MKILLEKITIPTTVVFILFLVKFLNPEFSDPDFYWHLKTGEYIVSHRSIPNTDPFSYTFGGKHWVAHEWLSEVILYLSALYFGFTGIKALIASLFCATFIVLFSFSKRMIQNDIRALLISLAFFAPLMPYATPRPQVFTFFLFSILLYILLEFKYFGGTKKLITIPILMLVWVNLHGAYVVGFVLMAMFFFLEFVGYWVADRKNLIRKQDLLRLALAIAASAVTININPHFLEAWTYPLYLMSMEVSKGIIAEWRSPDFHKIFFKYFLVLIIGYLLCLVYSKKKPDLTELIIPIIFIFAGMVSQRHLPLTCFVLLLSISSLYKYLQPPAGLIKLFMEKRTVANAASTEISNSTTSYLNLILIVIVAASAFYMEMTGKNEKSINSMLPVRAVDYIIANNISGNMLNDYGYGGYLIYRLAPNQKVFIDGRADLYGDRFIGDFMSIYDGDANWKEKFNRFSIDYVICNINAPLRQLLLAEKSFREVFVDEFHSVLVRNHDKQTEPLISNAGNTSLAN